MTDPTETARALLRDAENYLSALHGSVARHDNLAANLGCAGCELRDRLAAALRAPAVVSAAAPSTDQAALIELGAQAIWARYSDAEPSRHGLVMANPHAAAEAVLSVLPTTAEDHRLALSEALGLGTGAPWDVIHDRVTELGLPPLDQDPVARRLGLLPAPADQAAVLTEAADVATARSGCPCNAAQLHRPGDLLTTHGPHEWIVQPGMDPVHCPGAGDPPPARPARQEPAYRLDRIRDAARLHRKQLISSSELYAVIEADTPAPDPSTSRAAVLLEAADALTAKAEAWYEEAVSDGDLGVGGGIEAAATELRRLAAEAPANTQGRDAHVCRPGASVYHCPSSGQIESDCHGGFGVCCDRPDQHTPAVVEPAEAADKTPAPVVCEGFQWIGQPFTSCDRCGQPAWEHAGEEVPVEGAGPFDNRRTVRPWKPGEADAIRAKWAPAAEAQQDGAQP